MGAVAAGEAAAMPKKDDQNDVERQHPYGRSNGDSRRRIRIAASVRGIPNLTHSDEDKNERPVIPEDRPGLEIRTPAVHEKEATDCDEDDGKDEGDSSGIAVLGHGTPPLSCTTRAKGK